MKWQYSCILRVSLGGALQGNESFFAPPNLNRLLYWSQDYGHRRPAAVAKRKSAMPCDLRFTVSSAHNANSIQRIRRLPSRSYIRLDRHSRQRRMSSS